MAVSYLPDSQRRMSGRLKGSASADTVDMFLGRLVREFYRSGVARQSLLSALSALGALALPRREAAGVEMVFVQFGYFAVGPELSLELHLIPPQCFAADRTRLTAPGTAHDAVGTLRRSLPILNRLAGLLSEGGIVHL